MRNVIILGYSTLSRNLTQTAIFEHLLAAWIRVLLEKPNVAYLLKLVVFYWL
jgi:hypothetical protein